MKKLLFFLFAIIQLWNGSISIESVFLLLLFLLPVLMVCRPEEDLWKHHALQQKQQFICRNHCGFKCVSCVCTALDNLSLSFMAYRWSLLGVQDQADAQAAYSSHEVHTSILFWHREIAVAVGRLCYKFTHYTGGYFSGTRSGAIEPGIFSLSLVCESGAALDEPNTHVQI